MEVISITLGTLPAFPLLPITDLGPNPPHTQGRTQLTSCHDVTDPGHTFPQTGQAPAHFLLWSQVPGHSKVSWRPRWGSREASGEGPPPSAGGNMAVNREVTLFFLLLSCRQEAELQPINMTSGTVTVDQCGRWKTCSSLGPESGRKGLLLPQVPPLLNLPFIPGEMEQIEALFKIQNFMGE